MPVPSATTGIPQLRGVAWLGSFLSCLGRSHPKVLRINLSFKQNKKRHKPPSSDSAFSALQMSGLLSHFQSELAPYQRLCFSAQDCQLATELAVLQVQSITVCLHAQSDIQPVADLAAYCCRPDWPAVHRAQLSVQHDGPDDPEQDRHPCTGLRHREAVSVCLLAGWALPSLSSCCALAVACPLVDWVGPTAQEAPLQ